MHDSATMDPTSKLRLWVGLIGGGVVWMAHLLLAYAIAEFGCLTTLREVSMLGATGVWWSLLGTSVISIAAAAAATAAAWSVQRRSDPTGSAFQMGRAGVLCSGLFTGIIGVQSLPILFFVTHC